MTRDMENEAVFLVEAMLELLHDAGPVPDAVSQRAVRFIIAARAARVMGTFDRACDRGDAWSGCWSAAPCNRPPPAMGAIRVLADGGPDGGSRGAPLVKRRILGWLRENHPFGWVHVSGTQLMICRGCVRDGSLEIRGYLGNYDVRLTDSGREGVS